MDPEQQYELKKKISQFSQDELVTWRGQSSLLIWACNVAGVLCWFSIFLINNFFAGLVFAFGIYCLAKVSVLMNYIRSLVQARLAADK
jgi:hypothetical protein